MVAIYYLSCTLVYVVGSKIMSDIYMSSMQPADTLNVGMLFSENALTVCQCLQFERDITTKVFSSNVPAYSSLLDWFD